MSAVVADTHVVVWALLKQEKLSPDALAALQGAIASGDRIWLSAISVVEIAYLVEKRRLPESAFERLMAELSRPDSGLAIAPLDLPIAQAVRRIPREQVPEMPDRIIAATALYLGLPLVTRDLAIQSTGLHVVW
jgi:PIN domain nuclease of toxin-antitoxin system